MTCLFQRPLIVRLVGWIYVAIGAAMLASVIGDIGAFIPPPGSEKGRHLEWVLTFPFALLAAGLFAYAGYRVLTRPPLHRRRTVWFGFVVLTVFFVIQREWLAM